MATKDMTNHCQWVWRDCLVTRQIVSAQSELIGIGSNGARRDTIAIVLDVAGPEKVSMKLPLFLRGNVMLICHQHSINSCDRDILIQMQRKRYPEWFTCAQQYLLTWFPFRRHISFLHFFYALNKINCVQKIMMFHNHKHGNVRSNCNCG